MSILDTRKAFERLTAAGFDKEKAEALLDTLGETGESLATKADLRDLEQRMTIRLGGLVAAGVAILAVLEVFTQLKRELGDACDPERMTNCLLFS